MLLLPDPETNNIVNAMPTQRKGPTKDGRERMTEKAKKVVCLIIYVKWNEKKMYDEIIPTKTACLLFTVP